ncbi:hypothetical protein JDV02_007306 [Purpureocillium takamizusanense]|uniref:Uncharacterized protein n=1 Tax=Purpureocillium takamizusanense TaxID=2060973 RepID=A0A9Q8VC73_9HYPO|nr:uncharacterized protein JDV02_007306 [Purpureocillium takamizusanense]UNI21305.1 hypothetical protein JDV02_007306 [Purpureocillium takamizusanense]
MKEVIEHGSDHMKVLIEAICAEHNRFSGIQRYRKDDYARWFANYDCLIEVPFFMGSEAIEAYVDDPDVRFLLTERDPDKWVTSINNTVAGVVQMASAFPIRLLKHFNDDLYYFFLLNELIYASISDSTLPGDAENRSNMRRNYVSYIAMVKRTIPADRLCHIQLENGLGWNEICPFLDVDVPDEEYPRGNEPEKFQALVGDWLRPRMASAALKLAGLATLSGTAAVGLWLCRRTVKAAVLTSLTVLSRP